jgi:hypothetical protein
MATRSIVRATKRGTRLDQLQLLANKLATEVEACDDPRLLPQLAKQYRETIRELDELKGMGQDDDEIGEILAKREADGCAGAVR